MAARPERPEASEEMTTDFDRPGAPAPSTITRRRFIGGAAAGVFGMGAFGQARRLSAQSTLPAPESSGIDHIVVVMMENRSYDHFLGWMPKSDGRQEGLTYLDANGVAHPTFPLAPDFQGCAHPDPDHSYEGGRVEHNAGACDGWLRAGTNDEFSIGYYTKEDLGFFAKAAPEWTVCDRTSRRSWPRPSRTAYTSTPPRRTASRTRSRSANFPRSGTG